ncbi:MAG: hypothetical protein ABI670_21960 [Chloroflexota bacterium]
MYIKKYAGSGLAGGLGLIALGFVFFTATQHVLNFDWDNIWSLFPVVGGVGLLVKATGEVNYFRRATNVAGGTLLLLLGAFFVAVSTLQLLDSSDSDLWPVYPVAVGIALLAGYLSAGRRSDRYVLLSCVLCITGVVFAGLTVTGASYAPLGELWPIAVVAAGALIVVHSARPAAD